jgi:hypothetical protein
MEIKKVRVIQFAMLAFSVLMVILYFSMKSTIDKMRPEVGMPVVLTMVFIYLVGVFGALGFEISIKLQNKRDSERVARPSKRYATVDHEFVDVPRTEGRFGK